MSAGVAHLRSLVAPVVARHGLFLEGVEVRRAGRRVTVLVTVDLSDGPGGVGADALADVSRDVSAALDEDDTFPGSYVLEVSTPGADRPLREPRHFRRAIGRLVTLRTTSGERVAGRVRTADDEAVTLGDDGSGRTAGRTLRYSDVAAARVEVELRAALGEGAGDEEGAG